MNEPHLDSEDTTLKVTTIVEAAAEFGLAPEEIWSTVAATLDRLPAEAKARCFEELSGALAARLLEKERGIRRNERHWLVLTERESEASDETW
jgi:hypothetical protein